MLYSGKNRRKYRRFNLPAPVLLYFNLKDLRISDIGFINDISYGGISLYTNRFIVPRMNVFASLGKFQRKEGGFVSFEVLDCKIAEGHTKYNYVLRANLMEEKGNSILAYRYFVESIKNKYEALEHLKYPGILKN